MEDGVASIESTVETYTLLGVRADGIASVVDLLPADSLETVRAHAAWLLREHKSCQVVEVWKGGALVEELRRSS